MEKDQREMYIHEEGAPRHAHVHAGMRHNGMVKGKDDQREVGAV